MISNLLKTEAYYSGQKSQNCLIASSFQPIGMVPSVNSRSQTTRGKLCLSGKILKTRCQRPPPNKSIIFKQRVKDAGLAQGTENGMLNL